MNANAGSPAIQGEHTRRQTAAMAVATAAGVAIAAVTYTAMQQLYSRRHSRLLDAEHVQWICSSPASRVLRLDRNAVAVHLSAAREAAADADAVAKDGSVATPASLSIARLTGTSPEETRFEHTRMHQARIIGRTCGTNTCMRVCA